MLSFNKERTHAYSHTCPRARTQANTDANAHWVLHGARRHAARAFLCCNNTALSAARQRARSYPPPPKCAAPTAAVRAHHYRKQHEHRGHASAVFAQRLAPAAGELPPTARRHRSMTARSRAACPHAGRSSPTGRLPPPALSGGVEPGLRSTWCRLVRSPPNMQKGRWSPRASSTTQQQRQDPPGCAPARATGVQHRVAQASLDVQAEGSWGRLQPCISHQPTAARIACAPGPHFCAPTGWNLAISAVQSLTAPTARPWIIPVPASFLHKARPVRQCHNTSDRRDAGARRQHTWGEERIAAQSVEFARLIGLIHPCQTQSQNGFGQAMHQGHVHKHGCASPWGQVRQTYNDITNTPA